MEVAMKLLEKDIHEKQDTIVSLRRQLDDIKLINLEMYKKLQVRREFCTIFNLQRNYLLLIPFWSMLNLGNFCDIEILKATSMKMTILGCCTDISEELTALWDVVPCSVIDID
jgi:hypothetical protein